jgi:hypothetical protein
MATQGAHVTEADAVPVKRKGNYRAYTLARHRVTYGNCRGW